MRIREIGLILNDEVIENALYIDDATKRKNFGYFRLNAIYELKKFINEVYVGGLNYFGGLEFDIVFIAEGLDFYNTLIIYSIVDSEEKNDYEIKNLLLPDLDNILSKLLIEINETGYSELSKHIIKEFFKKQIQDLHTTKRIEYF